MKTIFITGGAGFIGSHLAKALLTDYRVVVIDNFITGSYDNVKHLIDHENFRLIKQDVSVTLENWATLEEQVDYIIHLASPASPKHYMKYPIETLKANSYGTHNVLELARKFGARILVASTSEVYGDPLVHPQTENYYGNVNTIGPRACYDEGKRYMEAAVSTYARIYGLDIRIARLFNTYGPRMSKDDGRVVSEFINQALINRPLQINGDGLQTRSLCYVSDTVDGIIKLLFSEEKLPVNIGNPDETTVWNLAYEILVMCEVERFNVTAHMEFLPAQQNDPLRRCPDISLAVEKLGWEPKISRKEGLKTTIEWYRANS